MRALAVAAAAAMVAASSAPAKHAPAGGGTNQVRVPYRVCVGGTRGLPLLCADHAFPPRPTRPAPDVRLPL